MAHPEKWCRSDPVVGEDDSFARTCLSYLVFNVYKTPRIKLLARAEQVKEEIKAAYGDIQIPKELKELVDEAADSAWEEEAW